MKRISWLVIFLLSLSLSPLAQAEEIRFRINGKIYRNYFSAFQGDTIKIELTSNQKKVRKSTEPFSVTFAGNTNNSFLMRKYQTALIGVDYRLKPGIYTLVAKLNLQPNFSLQIPFQVTVKEKFPKLKDYIPKEREKSKRERVGREKEQVKKAWEQLSSLKNKLKPFIQPLRRIKINSEFGKKRCRGKINGTPNCRYHEGTDYRAAFDERRSIPEPVYAINDGIVVLKENHLANGNIIIIDHGNGISSSYLHLSKIFVAPGIRVTRGQQIGMAGNTGESEGIHLHLIIHMNYGKTIIDPHKFLQRVAR